MKTLKVMGIIGLILSFFAWIGMLAYNNPTDYEAAIGWGVIMMFYLIAYSIIGIVQSNKK